MRPRWHHLLYVELGAHVVFTCFVYQRWWVAASILGVLMAWGVWVILVHLGNELLGPPPPGSVEPEVKTYPPGCLCIPNALLDNPRCPHHGCSWCQTVDPGCSEHSTRRSVEHAEDEPGGGNAE